MTTARVTLLHVINSLDRGGAERAAVELLRHLDRDRFAPEVMTLYRMGDLASELIDIGVSVSSLGLPPELRMSSVVRLHREIRRRAPRIVHTHLPEATWLGLPAAVAARVPVRVSQLQNTHPSWDLRLRTLDRNVARLRQRSLACSVAVARYHADVVGYPAETIRVLFNPVDTGRFRWHPPAGATADPSAPPTLVCVASLTSQKGHADLLDAVALLRPTFPTLRLLLVGEGPLREVLRERTVAHGIEGNVEFLGRRSDVEAVLSTADLFVLASHWEGLGLVLAEAAATGLPAVATRIDGIPEVVEDGTTGLLVPPRDSAALARAIAELLGDRPRLRAMGRAARGRAERHFDVRQLAARLGEHYEELLAGTAGG